MTPFQNNPENDARTRHDRDHGEVGEHGLEYLHVRITAHPPSIKQPPGIA
jgi:hypothetical protein